MESKWTIRETKRSDVQAVFSVIFVSWLDTYVNNDIGVTKEFVFDSQFRYLNYKFYSEDCKFEYFDNTRDNLQLVAVDDNEVVLGFLHCKREGSKQVFEGLYLLPELKGAGLAQDFAARFLGWEDKSIDSELGVVEYNTRAIRFYEKLGFEPNGIKYKIRAIIPCIDMVKKNSGNKE